MPSFTLVAARRLPKSQDTGHGPVRAPVIMMGVKNERDHSDREDVRGVRCLIARLHDSSHCLDQISGFLDGQALDVDLLLQLICRDAWRYFTGYLRLYGEGRRSSSQTLPRQKR
jgi:hypothetical protein